jgi:hypothetical protein
MLSNVDPQIVAYRSVKLDRVIYALFTNTHMRCLDIHPFLPCFMIRNAFMIEV